MFQAPGNARRLGGPLRRERSSLDRVERAEGGSNGGIWNGRSGLRGGDSHAGLFLAPKRLSGPKAKRPALTSGVGAFLLPARNRLKSKATRAIRRNQGENTKAQSSPADHRRRVSPPTARFTRSPWPSRSRFAPTFCSMTSDRSFAPSDAFL